MVCISNCDAASKQEPVLFVCSCRICVHLRRCVCICGYDLPPRPLRSNNVLEIHSNKCLCVCTRTDYRVLFSLCCHPIRPFHHILEQFSLMNRSNPYAHDLWPTVYIIRHQPMPSFCGVPTIPHPSLTLLFFYLSHSHFSISISILSQDAFFPPHFSLQMGKDMAANNKPTIKKR